MSKRGPSFDDLVGENMTPAERERLHRVHELLIEAGPPPEPPLEAPVALRSRRRRGSLLAIAAALAVAVFAIGVVVGDRSEPAGVDFVVAMSGTAAATSASASLTVFDIDDAGNWPMQLAVVGLAPAASGRSYELWLTKDGELAALCGGFLTDAGGSADVPMNAPYNFSNFDGWVVVEEGSSAPLLTT
ncbi:MAG: anti-sigma factor domain-containing protein [Gaiellaceae bacterium]